jgi:mannosyltransferase
MVRNPADSPTLRHSLDTMRAMDAPPTGSSSVAEAGPVAPAHPGESTRPIEDGGAGDRTSPEAGSPGAEERAGGSGAGRGRAVAAADPEGRPFGEATVRLFVIATGVILVAGLVLRFWTRSDLWLDEALTVNIAGQPLHDLPSLLRRDGAPPLFYILLHFWMGLFGTSDLAVRALPGVIGVATVPLAWLAGRRLGGRTVGWAAMLLVASSPFAVRYDSEARMYSLVAFLTVAGFLALNRALVRPRPWNLIAVGAVVALLLYTHYWSIYLVGTVALWLVWQAWRGKPEWRAGAKACLIAGAVGVLAFAPWLPTFVFQSRHTGTPWSTPASFGAAVSSIAQFAGGSTSQGRGLALIFFALAGLGLFGIATDRRHIDLDIRTRPLGRPIAIVIAGTYAAAIAGGLLTNSAFDPRYASVIFIPLILLVALGLTVFQDRRVRVGILAVAIAAGFAGSVPNVYTNRTQAGQVAAAIRQSAHPGDVVAYCPDQLGPAVNRLLPAGQYRQTTFPRGTGPEFVNWVDYAAAVQAASPADFAVGLESEAAPAGRQIFVVWAGGYQGYGLRCEHVVETLQANPNYRVSELVIGDDVTFYQPMWLMKFTPVNH